MITYIFIAYLVLMSIISFIAYWIDKRRGIKHSYRIKEKVLLLLGFLGGAVGALLAMYTIRHKTKAEHWYFTLINVLGIIWQAIVIYLLIKYL